MTNLQKKQNLCALAGTVAVWILIFILIPLVSLLPEPPVYKSVQITLSEKSVPKPAEKKLESSHGRNCFRCADNAFERVRTERAFCVVA